MNNVKGFLKPLIAKKYLTKAEIKAIFSNIDEIQDVTSTTLKSFEAARTPTGLIPNIGVLFLQNVRLYILQSGSLFAYL